METLQVTITAPETAELLARTQHAPIVAEGHVGGRTLASLISAGTELSYCYQGQSFPSFPGYAAVFQVEEVGAGVTNVAVGDRVLAMGAHASYQVHPATDVWLLPPGLEPADATFARLMGVSMSTLTTTSARPPQKVVVAGLGPVGHLAAQLFQAAGYEVLGCDLDEGRLELATRGGLRHVMKGMPLEDPEWRGQVALVLECAGHEQAVLDGCNLVRKGGEVVLIGVPWKQRTALSAQALTHAIFHNYAVVRSGWEWEVPRRVTDFAPGSIDGNIAAALSWLRQGRVRAGGLYATYSPADCQQAYQNLLTAREKNLAIVFDWSRVG